MDTINRNINKIYIVMTAFAVVLLLIIVLLMNNTIRLALYSQRMLIRSMQLVGATNGFITRPFLLRGLWQGLLAGTLASGAPSGSSSSICSSGAGRSRRAGGGGTLMSRMAGRMVLPAASATEGFKGWSVSLSVPSRQS